MERWAELRSLLSDLGRDPGPHDVAGALRTLGVPVTDEVVLASVRRLRRDSMGAGPLEELLALPGVTDVVVNGPDGVYVDCGAGLEHTDVHFADDDEVAGLASRFAATAGRRFDEGQPYVDCQLSDGTRVHAILAGIAAPGTCLSLRVPNRRRMTVADWGARGSAHPRMVAALTAIMECQVAFLVAGGTGAGKTTLLASLLGLVPARERLVIVEDSRELAVDHPHVVSLEARSANAEGAGQVPLAALVRQALRMRPDRVVVGEVRGAEVVDLLVALNTGHEGGCGTIHANGLSAIPARLEALGALAGWSKDALHPQVAAALRVAIQVTRRGRQRRVSGIGVLDRVGGALVCQPALVDAGAEVRTGPGADALAEILS